MRPYVLGTICFTLWFCSAAHGQDLDPVRPTAEQDSLFRGAITVHDQGKYDQAIEIYTSLLKENPHFVEAITELSITCLAAKEYDTAIELATRGLRYKGGLRPVLYLNLGTACDELGRPLDAIVAYQKGIALAPRDYLLHYNLGFTFARQQEADSSRVHLQSALRCKPSHPTSNLVLGRVYEALGKRIPAIYAYARFLLLEPNSARSASTAEKLRALLADSLSVRPNGDDNMTITVAPDSDAIDGDVTALVLSLAMTQTSRSLGDSIAGTLPDAVARHITEGKGASPLALVSSDLSNFFQITAEMLEGEEQQEGFVWEYYVPYFAALHGMGFTELATHWIFQSTEASEAQAYFRTHSDALESFKRWNKGYDWRQ